MDIKTFTLRVQNYINGELEVITHAFDRLEDAVEAGVKAACHSFKVHDQRGCVHHDSHHHHHHHHDHYA